jgi:hypothetical protein
MFADEYNEKNYLVLKETPQTQRIQGASTKQKQLTYDSNIIQLTRTPFLSLDF